MQRCDLRFPIKRINGSSHNNDLTKLNFFNADNTVSALIGYYNDGYGLAADCYLEDEEDIIGVYGIKN